PCSGRGASAALPPPERSVPNNSSLSPVVPPGRSVESLLPSAGQCLGTGSGACPWRRGGPPPQGLDLLPQPLPVSPLALGPPGQGVGATHAGEVGVRQPVLHRLGDGRGGPVRFPGQQSLPGIEVGPQPVEGLAAEASTLSGIALSRVLALAATGQ